MTANTLIAQTAAVICGLVVAVGAAGAEPTTPATASPTAKAEHCLPLKSIRNTRIVDDSNVLFYTNGSNVYKNQLPHRCSGLRSADTFLYRTSQSELCNLDIITVLNRIGSDFTPGPSCGLGLFEPIDKAAAEALLKAAKR
jgi:hypothetical protein